MVLRLWSEKDDCLLSIKELLLADTLNWEWEGCVGFLGKKYVSREADTKVPKINSFFSKWNIVLWRKNSKSCIFYSCDDCVSLLLLYQTWLKLNIFDDLQHTRAQPKLKNRHDPVILSLVDTPKETLVHVKECSQHHCSLYQNSEAAQISIKRKMDVYLYDEKLSYSATEYNSWNEL